MRATAIGAALGAGLVLALLAATTGRESAAQPPGNISSGSELITLATPVGEDRQLLTVIDPRARVISVYHIELATGEIALKSVREIGWDLQMTEFNGVSPLPREIRSLIGQR